MVLVERQGLPLGVLLEAATVAEVALAEATLAQVRVPRWRGSRRGPGRPRTKPARLVADRGYDSRGLWERLKRRGIDLIVPHLRTRTRRWQDGRKLRRYRHRWIVERTNAWLQSFRRLAVRYEHELMMYRAFLHLACAIIALRRL
jgi:transposase